MSHPDDTVLDDVAVEKLLAGAFRGDAGDLVGLADVVATMASLVDERPPTPSPTLARILAGGEAPAAAAEIAADAPPRRLVRRMPATAPRHERRTRWSTFRRAWAVGAAAGGLSLGTVAAGAAGVLPGPAQRVVSDVVRAVTPFQVPEPAPASPPSVRATTTTVALAAAARGADPSPPPAGGAPTTTVPAPAPAVAGASAATATSPAPVSPSTRAQPPVPTTAGRPGGEAAKPARLVARLDGAVVVPAPGDPDATGTATVTVNRARDELCLEVKVAAAAAVTAIQVRVGAPGTTGPPVARVEVRSGASGTGCAVVGHDVLDHLQARPGDFYVEVDTREFAGGALRGQLAPA